MLLALVKSWIRGDDLKILKIQPLSRNAADGYAIWSGVRVLTHGHSECIQYRAVGNELENATVSGM